MGKDIKYPPQARGMGGFWTAEGAATTKTMGQLALADYLSSMEEAPVAEGRD